jgi:hypothetical protein
MTPEKRLGRTVCSHAWAQRPNYRPPDYRNITTNVSNSAGTPMGWRSFFAMNSTASLPRESLSPSAALTERDYSACDPTPAQGRWPVLKLRIFSENPDHHLWDNRGTWCVHYTLHLSATTKKRVRRSLGTKDLLVARARRDRLFQDLSRRCTPLSPLEKYLLSLGEKLSPGCIDRVEARTPLRP